MDSLVVSHPAIVVSEQIRGHKHPVEVPGTNKIQYGTGFPGQKENQQQLSDNIVSSDKRGK